jgi:DNA-directed RNA polymerase subunit RPC12/RpoP
MPDGRCMKCKKQVEIKNPQDTFLNGKVKMKAVKGLCPHCGTKVFKIVCKA